MREVAHLEIPAQDLARAKEFSGVTQRLRRPDTESTVVGLWENLG
jgi:hypothetical protein